MSAGADLGVRNVEDTLIDVLPHACQEVARCPGYHGPWKPGNRDCKARPKLVDGKVKKVPGGMLKALRLIGRKEYQRKISETKALEEARGGRRRGGSNPSQCGGRGWIAFKNPGSYEGGVLHGHTLRTTQFFQLQKRDLWWLFTTTGP